jgi:hypothetical protein
MLADLQALEIRNDKLMPITNVPCALLLLDAGWWKPSSQTI